MRSFIKPLGFTLSIGYLITLRILSVIPIPLVKTTPIRILLGLIRLFYMHSYSKEYLTLKRLEEPLIELPITEKTWDIAQERYCKWSKSRLPLTYLATIIKRGKDFSKFIGSPNICLDIGFGNGLIGGLSYKEIGYNYIEKPSNAQVIGIDPLPLEGPKPPWLTECVMAVCENLPFRQVFDKAVIATSLDHLIDLDKSLEEISGIPQTYIWCNIFKHPRGDRNHPKRITWKQLKKALTTHKLRVNKNQKIHSNRYASTNFIEIGSIYYEH